MGTAFMSDVPFSDEDMLASHMGDMVDTAIKTHGENPAFSCVLPTGHSKTLNYAELGQYIDAVAVYLREELGLRRGDVVAIQCPNTLAYPVLAFGIFKAGLTITNINPLYTPDETNHQLKDSGAKVWFVVDVFGDRVVQSTKDTSVEHIYKLSVLDFFPPLQKAILGFAMRYLKKVVPPFEGQISGTMTSVIKTGKKYIAEGVDIKAYTKNITLDDVAIYQYTGGTTGRSKGAELTHRNVVGNISQAKRRDDSPDMTGDDCMMLLLPLYHVYALSVGALSCMHSGTHVALIPVPRPLSNLKKAFEKFNITLLPGINTLYLGLMQENWFVENPPKNLRFCFSGAAPLQPATAEAWKKLTGADIYEGYGLTESTCVVSSMPFDRPPKQGTCGIPIPGTQVRIVGDDGQDVETGEAGEIWIKGPQVIRGYYNNPEETENSFVDGWFKTGDVGTLDDEGYLSIVDRIKDMIIVSGFNVFPADVEDVLTLCDDVAEAAVVGIPDDETGEKAVAFIVKANENSTEQIIMDECKGHLTNYKRPKAIHFVDELPKSPIGKILRRELRDEAKRIHGL